MTFPIVSLEELKHKLMLSKEPGILGVTLMSPDFQKIYEEIAYYRRLFVNPEVKATVDKLERRGDLNVSGHL